MNTTLTLGLLFASVIAGAIVVEIFKPKRGRNIQILLTFSGAYLLAVSVLQGPNVLLILLQAFLEGFPLFDICPPQVLQPDLEPAQEYGGFAQGVHLLPQDILSLSLKL